MHRSLATAGLLAGLAVFAAGTARADCQASEFCVDGICHPIQACGNVEPVGKTAVVVGAAIPGKTDGREPQAAAASPIPASAAQRAAAAPLSREQLRNELRPMGTRRR
jgi:hypothetical protein